jgi:hypothetical protein
MDGPQLYTIDPSGVAYVMFFFFNNHLSFLESFNNFACILPRCQYASSTLERNLKIKLKK